MNTHHLSILPLLLAPLCAQEAPATTPNIWEHFDACELNRKCIGIVYELVSSYHSTREKTPEKATLPDMALFLEGFRYTIEHGSEATMQRAIKHRQEQRDFVLKQLPVADFLPPHAAQPGVEKLPNGLQYDVYTAATPADNYRARRAHRLIARVPGSEIFLHVSSTPQAIDDALYEAPRGRAWRFLLPVSLLEKTDRIFPERLKIKAVEIMCVRESMEEEDIEAARQFFAAKQPPLPVIAMTNAAFEREDAVLNGAREAMWIDADERHLARVEALWQQYGNESQESFKQLEKAWLDAIDAAQKAREDLTRLQHNKLTPEIMAAQEQIPGTHKLPNGVLYRSVQTEGLNKPLTEARFIEEEELGPEYYLRVRDRVIAEGDLPKLLRELAPQLPAATEWQIVIPPALRGKEHDLPLIYRLRLQRKQQQEDKKQKPFLAPDLL